MCQCSTAYPASTLRIHNVSGWLQFGQVNFLRENCVVTTYFRIPHMSKFCSILSSYYLLAQWVTLIICTCAWFSNTNIINISYL